MNLNELKYNDQGLIPAIITDARTGKVLMLAYMNSESLEITIKEERTCFFSRSRNELWRKGETSGNVQQVVSIATDCDKDTLLISVIPAGPACHTGNESCFFNPILENAAPFTIQGLYELIMGRKTDKKEGSYTTYLFEKGRDKILKKVGEEATEVIIGGKADDKAETIYELADLMYHALVLMADMDISVDDVLKELASRHVIDKKVKQEKMA